MPQLAYVVVTPYSLYKSRTGGILSRLITRTGLDLVDMRMFAPSAELAKAYADTIVSAHDTQDRKIQELLKDYVLQNLSPDPKTGDLRPSQAEHPADVDDRAGIRAASRPRGGGARRVPARGVACRRSAAV